MAEHYKPVKYKAWEMTLEERFQEYHPPLSDREAVLEANRCLYCHDAPCMVACPTHIDIPTFIRKIATENPKGSARTILEANLLGATCSRVCPVQELCEGACVMEHDHKPIMIGRLQRYAMDYAQQKNIKFFHQGKPNGYKVAVIGSGPAGLSCAGELAKLGFDVTCYEKNKMAGGLDTYGIVVFREPVEVSLAEVKMVEELGVKMKTGVTVGKDITFKEIVDSNDAVFVGVGLGSVPPMGIPGEDFEGVVDGLDFIAETKTEKLDTIKFGNRICVIGAGNTGIDCATIARRLGSERVTIVYRRSEAEMPAYHFEYLFALGEGVSFMFLTQPVEVVGANGKVEGLKCMRMDLGEPDQSGRRVAVPNPGSEFVIPCDMIITAIGQKKQSDVMNALNEFGVKATHNGYISVDPETNRTDNPKIFAGGDCIRSKGEASTVAAVQDGKIAAAAIHMQLVGIPSPNKKHIEPVLSPVV
ncbi:MAG: NAD(P)-dependent oxidoreductase [Candidatus Obscuribacterales bacterium]|jgi:glutamate synthase (NADPH/NADH) small chain|nr:NAD(P)-dependent oxidoreductase [Candidatus Obscuribacterales bacterium]